MSADPETLKRVIAKCEDKAARLNRSGCLGQARVAEELAASFKSMLSAETRRRTEASKPRCACCGTTENLHRDVGSGGPYRCNSVDCMVF